MRLCSFLLLISVLLLVPELLLSTSGDYYAELFGTSDFALITQQNCARYFETDIGSRLGQCPMGLCDAPNLDALDHDCQNVKADTVRSHLIRDVHQKQSPRVLYVFNVINKKTPQRLQLNYGTETLSMVGNYSQWITPDPLRENSYVNRLMQHGDSLADSIFDTKSGLLYLVIKTSSATIRKLRVVYVNNMFGKADFTDFDREFVLHSSNVDKFDWVENPYEHTVYYAKRNSSHTAIHRLPISDVLKHLIDGTDGDLISVVASSPRYLIWAHNGAMISMARSNEDRGPMTDYYLRNATMDKKGRRCQFPDELMTNEQEVKKTRRLITLFDWDYCKLAYGGDGTKGPDGRQCPIYYDVLAVSDKSGSNNTIFIVLIVLLAMISVVLAVYVCLLRRNLDDSLPHDDRKPVPYYPSGQPLDSTFDMSVDRWDQY